MTEREIFMKLFDFSINTYYLWRKQGRLIFNLLEKYFSKEDLEEFVKTGKIQRLENQGIDNVFIDHAFYSSKQKLKDFFGGNPFGPNKAYTKGAKEILIDVLKKISSKNTSFQIDNAKEKLLDHISEEELKWLSIKNPAKRDLLSHYIKENFSNAEALAMLQKSDEIVEFLGKI